ncbi:hypothetical protein F5888DRAFT_1213823 [Russula emetica]|nr:hypothetical protein F5888DRAFT_1213823 [Russula emetica]
MRNLDAGIMLVSCSIPEKFMKWPLIDSDNTCRKFEVFSESCPTPLCAPVLRQTRYENSIACCSYPACHGLNSTGSAARRVNGVGSTYYLDLSINLSSVLLSLELMVAQGLPHHQILSATTPHAASRHRVPLIHAAYGAPCARHPEMRECTAKI